MTCMERIDRTDWCHICGNRKNSFVSLFYPFNAEHPEIKGIGHHVRICISCVDLIKETAQKGGVRYVNT